MTVLHRLDWSSAESGVSLDLVSADWATEGDFWFEVLADGFEAGSSEAVRETIASLFVDGEYAIRTREGNLTKSFTVQVCAHDPEGLAAGERALDLMRGRRTSTLTWTPPEFDGLESPASVRTVLVAELDHLHNDLDEMLYSRRTYRVTLECLPWVTPTEPAVVSFDPAVAAAGVSVRSAGSLAGWTVVSGSASISGGRITADVDNTVVETTPTVDLDGWLLLTVKGNNGLAVDGVSLLAGRDYVESVSGSDKLLNVRSQRWRGARPTIRVTLAFTGNQVASLVARPFFDASGLVPFEVKGSRRAAATVRVSTSAAALGNVYLWSGPDPNALLQEGVPWTVFGQVTVTEDVAVGRGGYVMVGGIPRHLPAGTTRDTMGVTTAAATFTGNIVQPPAASITVPAQSNTVTVDATFAYPMCRDGVLTALQNVSKKYLWVVPPRPGDPTGGLFYGNAADGTDAVPFPLAKGDVWSPHAIHPDVSGLRVSASGTVTVQATYSPAFAYHVTTD